MNSQTQEVRSSLEVKAMPKFWRRPLDADSIQVPKGEIHILRERCKGCGFCVEYCPTSVLELSDEFNLKGYHPPFARLAQECVHCQLCETICPEFAIFVTLQEANSPGKGVSDA